MKGAIVRAKPRDYYRDLRQQSWSAPLPHQGERTWVYLYPCGNLNIFPIEEMKLTEPIFCLDVLLWVEDEGKGKHQMTKVIIFIFMSGNSQEIPRRSMGLNGEWKCMDTAKQDSSSRQ